MAASLRDLHLLVVTPFYSPLLHCTRVLLWAIEFGKSVGMSFLKLEQTLLFPSQLLLFSWVICSGRSQQLCCEQPALWRGPCYEELTPCQHHVRDVESGSSSPPRLCRDCSPSWHLHYRLVRDSEPEPPI